MKKFLKVFFTISLAVLVLAACGDNDKTSNVAGNSDGDKLQVVSSFTIITDIVRQIGGDLVDVHNLVPTGTDPHEYEPLPEDSIKATDADILLYNGMNLEGGANGWFFKMLDSVGQDESNAYSLTERVEPMYLTDEQTKEEEINPHTFIDPTIGILMAEDMRDAFIEVDPDNKE
ncbi:MAG TPA: zinc ABC transporter substrate-binding protein, partial [Pseudogracilibacillus sp.]|nr:zinc ABC transporter substrate-binding protein [Pseudogracilibacillus sp.]